LGSVTDHYTTLLAPIYLWMAGGAESALAQGEAELSALKIGCSRGAPATDLGAGFGMHAIPLARLGYAVTAIDSSSLLLAQLRQLGGDTIQLVKADLLDFQEHLSAPQALVPQALILCMGDTLTHLQTFDEVARLCSGVAAALAPGGRFITTFRDYTHPVSGEARFIPVRSDADRIHTCFLEAEAQRILVHDIVHERQGETWSMKVSRYSKLRLDPAAVERKLGESGLTVARDAGPRGMVRITASRPA
jgi:SAM-dependent methyltransferase